MPKLVFFVCTFFGGFSVGSFGRLDFSVLKTAWWSFSELTGYVLVSDINLGNSLWGEEKSRQIRN